jgi:succinyl-CoA synthetase beta subunit
VKIHEYQAKKLFGKYRIPVPRGSVAAHSDEAVKIAQELSGFPVVVKAQIHAGGRGRGGGIRLAASSDEVRFVADEMIGMNLITRQTGSSGRLVKKVLVEEGLTIVREFYLSILVDRASAGIMVMASSAGGVNIEETAARTPENIIKVFINPLGGLQPYHCRQAGFGLGLDGSALKQFMTLLASLYRLFVDYDCSLVEINPLVMTADGRLMALDAKVDVDGNALFRQKEIGTFFDENEVDPLEVEAEKYQLKYINLGGTIGNLVNGAGLAMATMDIIKTSGALPANFLDVGGGASAEMVEHGLRIILGDTHVKGVLINIFGGILRCDVLAEGVVRAAGKTGINVPVVIRMEGTNVKQGRRILTESGLNFVTATDLRDAAEKVAVIAGN